MGTMTFLTVCGLSALGILAGFLSGLLGVGGGIVIVPALVLLYSISQPTAQGISLAMMAPVALMGAFRYYWSDKVHLDWRIVIILLIGAVVGTNIGSSVALSVSPSLLRRVFAVALFLISVKMFWF